MKGIAGLVLVILFGLEGGTVFGQTLRVPFDFSQSEIAIDATVNGEPLFLLLDTGVDPSFGNTAQPTAFPWTQIREH